MRTMMAFFIGLCVYSCTDASSARATGRICALRFRSSRGPRRPLRCAALLLLLTACPVGLRGAQGSASFPHEEGGYRAGELSLVAINALLGGLTACVRRGFSSDEFVQAFA